MTTPTHRTFADLAHHLCGYHPPKEALTAVALGEVRAHFDNLIDGVAPHVPEGPDATLAARAIHRACQEVIATIVCNQD